MTAPGTWVTAETCGALVEEAIRDALTGRFFKGTVEETLAAARAKVADLLADLDQADDAPGVHDGPVMPECPVKCLGLSARVYNRLTTFRTWSDIEAPRTVAEVLKLAETERLDDAEGIGPTYVREIEDALRRHGFTPRHDGGHDHNDQPPPEAEGPPSPTL